MIWEYQKHLEYLCISLAGMHAWRLDHASEAGDITRTERLVSPFSQNTWEADSKAFNMLMRHLKEADGNYSIVLMVQI